MSIENYESTFTELSKYVGSMMGTEEKRCRKFERGLHKEIRTPSDNSGSKIIHFSVD